MITVDQTNARAGVCSTDFLKYGSTTYGAIVYQLAGYYQSPIINRTRIDYTSSGNIVVQYRSGGSTAFSSWTNSTVGYFESTGTEMQFRVLYYTNDWTSTGWFEVINAI